ncbi:MAG: hypothetical protein U0790_06845 [Isosphaeraceae bacterium]
MDAMSGRAVEAAGDVDVLLLDKTGTITLGNRQATAFHPPTASSGAGRVLSSPDEVDETPEGRSIAVLAKTWFGPRGMTSRPEFVLALHGPDPDERRDLNGSVIRKGATDAVEPPCPRTGRPGARFPGERVRQISQPEARRWW